MKRIAFLAIFVASAACAQVNVQGTGIQLGGQVGAPPFQSVTAGTSTNTALVVGNGSSLTTTGTGTVSATALNNVTVSGATATGRVLAGSSASTATWQDLSNIFQQFTNCSTAGYFYSPASGACIASGTNVTGPQYTLFGATGAGSGSAYAIGATGLATDSTYSKLFLTGKDTTGGFQQPVLNVTAADTSLGAGILFTTAQPAQQATLQFNDSGLGLTNFKWQFGKDTDNSFFLYDAAGSRNVLSAVSNGDFTLMPNGCSSTSTTGCNLVIGNSYSPFNVTATGQVTSSLFKGNLDSDYVTQGKHNLFDWSFSPMGYLSGGYPSITAALSSSDMGTNNHIVVPYNYNFSNGGFEPPYGSWPWGTTLDVPYFGQHFFYEAVGDSGGNAGIFAPDSTYCIYSHFGRNYGLNNSINCAQNDNALTGIGSSYGNPGGGYTVNGWSGGTNYSGFAEVSESGIHSLFYGKMTKSGTGDTLPLNLYLSTKLGVTAPSDEGVKSIRTEVDQQGEAGSTLSTITHQTNAVDVWTVPAANGGDFMGNGQTVLDSTKSVTGGTQAIAATASDAATTYSGYTIPAGLTVVTLSGATVTPSVCSTLTANILPTPDNLNGTSTVETFTVNAPPSGAWNATDDMFIMSNLIPEKFIPTSVSGNSITAPIAQQHLAGDMICQGGAAGWAESQDNLASGNATNHYATWIAGALNSTTLVVGQVCAGVYCVSADPIFIQAGAVTLFPATMIVKGQNKQYPNGSSEYDDTLWVQPTNAFAVGDTLLFPDNISGTVTMEAAGDTVDSPFAYQRDMTFQNTSLASVHGRNFLGVWNIEHQNNLNVQTSGTKTLYAPHGFSVGEDANSANSSIADLWTVRYPPVGGRDYGNATPPHLLGVSDCWAPGTTFTAGSSSFDIFDEAPDGAALSYTPTCATYQVGTLGWNGNLKLTTNAATSASVNQGSSTITLTGAYWNGSGPSSDTWTLGSVLGTGYTPTSIYSFGHSGSTGGSAVEAPLFITNGPAQTAANIALDAGWGTGATVTAVSGGPQRFRFTITAGTTPAASPTFTATLSSPYPATPVCYALQTGGNGTVSDMQSGTETTTSTGAMTWLGTPVASSTYTVMVDCR